MCSLFFGFSKRRKWQRGRKDGGEGKIETWKERGWERKERNKLKKEI